jgi:ABC-type sugar transport system substrate-binding protein
MKKTLAIVLALVLVLMLFAACGGTSTTSPAASSAAPASSAKPAASSAAPAASSAASAASSAAPAASPSKAADSSGQANTGKSGDKPLDKVGFYDPKFDYSKGTKWKIQYMTATAGPLYEVSSNAFKFWCDKMNMSYSPMWSSGGDADAFLNNLQTFIKQGINAFIFDPDVNSYMRIQEICKEGKVQWMGYMSPARDYTDKEKLPLIHPFVGFDHYWFGQQMGLKMIDYMNTVWKDVPKDKIGYVSVDYSTVGVLHDRTRGAQDIWNEKMPSMKDQFYTADTAKSSPTLDGANTAVTAVLSAQTKYTHWLCSAMFDDVAMGAAAAFDSMGLTKNAVVCTIGGSSLQRQWDAGTQDAWKFAMFTPQTVYAEPVVGALYAFLTGQATPETIWPSWVNAKDHGKDTDKYASLLLPSYWMDHDNYKKLLEWSDVYAGASEYKYDATGITRDTYNARMDIPASYAG